MTEPDRYGEEIRRALSAAAELVVPAGDGLDIIRKRAARRPPVLAWLLAYVSFLPRQLATRVRVMASELAIMAKGESDLLPRLRARLHQQAGQARSARAWLRPALAGAAALLLVVAVTLAVPRLRETVTNQANTGPGGGPGGGAGSTGQVQGKGSQSLGASGSSTTGFESSGLQPPMVGSEPMPGRILYLMLPGVGGGVVPNPCVTSSTPYSPASGIPPTGGTTPTGSPASAATAGAPNNPQSSGNTNGGTPNCGPTGSSTPTPPVTTPPVTTPPTTTPPVTTPPTSTPPSSSTPATPTNGSTASTPASYPTESSSGS